jgi:hypothetical protein
MFVLNSKVLCFVALSWCVFVGSNHAPADSDSRVTRWLDDLQSIRNNCVITCFTTLMLEENIKTIETLEYSSMHLAHTVKSVDSSDVSRVVIANPHYSAKLQENKGGWLLEAVAQPSGSDYRDPRIGRVSNGFAPILTAGGVLEYIRSGHYRIEGSELREYLGRKHTVVALKLDPQRVAEIGVFPYESAFIWFDMEEQHSFPRRVDIAVDQNGKGASFLYSDFRDVGNLVLPTRAEAYSGILSAENGSAEAPPSPSVLYEYDFGRVHERPISTVFFLSHYGLPEPDFYTPPRPWWLYTSAVGVGLVLIGVLVLQLGRRLRRRS